MNKIWIRYTLGISLLLLTLLKSQELVAIKSFYMPPKTPKLETFKTISQKLKKEDLEALGVWESIITGKSKYLTPATKEKYQKLGLLHLFTPSGFHLSASLIPVMVFLKSQKSRLLALLCIGFGLWFVPGLAALKRMLLIKVKQNLFGQKTGFITGILTDMLFGSFQKSCLSFSYSFLFLGVIYSKVRGIGLIIWFFIAQIIITFFQGGVISPLLLILSPIINFFYGLILPILFLSSYPILNFQIDLSIWLIKCISYLINFSYLSVVYLPSIEVIFLTLLLLFFIMCRKWKSTLLLLIFYSNHLNSNYERAPGIGSNEFVSRGSIIKRVYEEKRVRIYFTDGRCDLKLIRGLWWENCSPRKRSS